MNANGLLAGLLFGVGLTLSGMTDPAKVLGFLDVTRTWDLTLVFVMGGAVLVALPLFAWARRRGRSFSGETLVLPKRWPVDAPLLAGATIFGIGWGLSGLCPGPALVLAGGGSVTAIVFVAALALGWWLSAKLRERLQPAASAVPQDPIV